ncbi:MAG: DUF1343 domain-containing protein [Chitinophagaceae bacterium]|nr:DUF1343 domain-containing protein [Chitinophagaceae bacterium]
MKKLLFLSLLIALSLPSLCQQRIITGAERMNQYLPLLKGKRIGLFANQTSMVGKVHLVDMLKKSGIHIQVIFGPEHGFRGTADAGEKVGNYIDKQTGIKVISLYGSKRAPSAEDLKDVDILIYDIQDVGVRFYTYISSMQEFMEAAFENHKPLIILDRPNPNGFYVDGPVLKPQFKSFVGMQPVPIVYGMTIGEYAKMLVGESWLSVTAMNAYKQWHPAGKGSFKLRIIKNLNYDHNSKYVLPVKPSPNLPDIQSIYWYPSTCFFEGTTLSEGRGTEKPFQIFGDPSLPDSMFSFTPGPREGAMNSKHYGQKCYGWNLSGPKNKVLKEINNQIQIKYILEAYKLFPDKENFFIKPKSGDMKKSFFDKLAGNDELWQQIKDQKSEKEIRESWQPDLDHFKKIRKKYLLYKDFGK